MWANLMLLFGTVAVAFAIGCEPDICSRVRCPNLPCGEHEILVKNGGVCGCCDICVGPYCGPNEIYSQCVNVCNECQYRNVTCNFLVCNRGCDCQPGYTRNDQRICIPEYLCPRGEGEPCSPNSGSRECDYGLICDPETNTCEKIFPLLGRAWLT